MGRRELPRAKVAANFAPGPWLVSGNVRATQAGGGEAAGDLEDRELPPGSEKRWLPWVLKASPGSGWVLRSAKAHSIGLISA